MTSNEAGLLLDDTYADCNFCHQQMNGTSCVETFEIEGSEYERIPYGSSRCLVQFPCPSHCRDCNAQVGGIHHAGCCVERCPRCGGQSISCDCED